MRRALLATGAALLLAAPALADQVTITTKTITKDVPETSGSTVPTVVVAPNPPPPPEAEIQPPVPGPGVAWIPGHWSWEPDAHNFVWLHGRYMEPPHTDAAWLPGRWVERDQGWVWEDGRWN